MEVSVPCKTFVRGSGFDLICILRRCVLPCFLIGNGVDVPGKTGRSRKGSLKKILIFFFKACPMTAEFEDWFPGFRSRLGDIILSLYMASVYLLAGSV